MNPKGLQTSVILTLLQASFLGFARSILGGKKKGGSGWVDNVKEGQALQVCSDVCVVMVNISISITATTIL
jgi:hypothetical protein